MGRIVVARNGSAVINLPDDAVDNGWVITGGKARHYACNSGTITKDIPLIVGRTYVIEYQIEEISSGYVQASIGSSSGPQRSTVGKFTETLTMSGTGALRMFSNANALVSFLTVSETSVVNNGVTFAFAENANKWVTYYSYQPELMVAFKDKFFTYKAGQLWQHNVNELRNNFYGVQYKSVVRFYVNIEPTKYKDFFSIRVLSNRVWSAPVKGDIYIAPSQGKSQGMSSRLKPKKFQRYGQDYYADFLKNMDDPRFMDEIEALMHGADLQGKVMRITLENTDTEEVKLLAVDVEMSPKELTI